jgi:hypothetical protein
MMNKVYLGDSVYCEMDNGMLKLTTENGYADDPRNVIFLEAEVVSALVEYVKATTATTPTKPVGEKEELP